jgi:hypothetical protein
MKVLIKYLKILFNNFKGSQQNYLIYLLLLERKLLFNRIIVFISNNVHKHFAIIKE